MCLASVIGLLERGVPFAQSELTLQTFSLLASPLLYSSVISDHLPSLLAGLNNSPAARGLSSKRKLLGRIGKLYLEYCSKQEPSYRELLVTGRAFFPMIGGGSMR